MLPLEGTLWQLTRYTSAAGAEVVAQPHRTESPTLQLKDGHLSGNATCNRFFGSYVLEGDTLTMRPGGSTRMSCPPEYMAQEQAFIATLGQVARYEIVESTLLLQNAEGRILLILEEVFPHSVPI